MAAKEKLTGKVKQLSASAAELKSEVVKSKGVLMDFKVPL